MRAVVAAWHMARRVGRAAPYVAGIDLRTPDCGPSSCDSPSRDPVESDRSIWAKISVT